MRKLLSSRNSLRATATFLKVNIVACRACSFTTNGMDLGTEYSLPHGNLRLRLLSQPRRPPTPAAEVLRSQTNDRPGYCHSARHRMWLGSPGSSPWVDIADVNLLGTCAVELQAGGMISQLQTLESPRLSPRAFVIAAGMGTSDQRATQPRPGAGRRRCRRRRGARRADATPSGRRAQEDCIRHCRGDARVGQRIRSCDRGPSESNIV